MKNLAWRKVAKGIWKAKIGAKTGVSYLQAADAKIAKDALAEMSDEAFPLPEDGFLVEKLKERVILSIPCDPEERLFGLGLNFKGLQVQRSVRHLHSDHFGGKDNGRTHAPVPFYVSSSGYGVFVDLARYVDVNACNVNRKESQPEAVDRFPVKPSEKSWTDVQAGRTVEFAMPAPGATVYVFAGPTPLEVVRRFNLLCGGGCLPPVWGLGFWHRVPVSSTAEQVAEEVKLFDEKGFPLDVLGLEPGWHSQSYPNSYEWNKERFPEPGKMVAGLLAKGIRVNLWENPHVLPSSPLGRKLEKFSGSYAAGWGGLVPDLSIPEARGIFAEHHKRTHLDLGVSGYKFDECDGCDQWLWPDYAQFPSGLSGEELRQLYGVLYQRMGCEASRAAGRRSFNLARASNAGAASFPFVLYNDYYDQRDYLTALCSASFCGVLWTPEVRSAKTPEEWLRRFQMVCLSPMALLNGWCDGFRPWAFKEVEAQVLATLKLRMRLIPYLYTAFAEYRRKGIPPFRAMALCEGFPLNAERKSDAKLDSTENPYAVVMPADVKDQYLAGASLLVAPLFAGETSRRIVLPAGRWFDFYTGAFVGEGPSVIDFAAPADGSMPLLVKDGGIIPLGPETLRSPSASAPVDLEIRHYGGAEGSFELYDDDGESFSYETGDFSWTRLAVSRDAAGVLRSSAERSAGRKSWLWKGLTWHFMGQ